MTGRSLRTPAPGRALLLVDDDADLATTLATTLRRLGWLVVVAGSSGEGLAALRSQPWHTVLCDLQLPGDSGLVVIRQAAALGARPRIVAITGMADESFYLKVARRAGADATLTKPFSKESLLAVLEASPPAAG